MHGAATLKSHGEADWELGSDRSDSVPNTRRTGQYSQGWNGNDARLTRGASRRTNRWWDLSGPPDPVRRHRAVDQAPLLLNFGRKRRDAVMIEILL